MKTSSTPGSISSRRRSDVSTGTGTGAAFDESNSNSSKEAILAFIQVCENAASEDEETTLSEQERLCRTILDELNDGSNDENDEDDFIRSSLKATTTSTVKTTTVKTTTVRQVLGNLPSVTINAFATHLSELMAHRVDPLLLMPATQDDVANEEAASSQGSITLTRHAFTAAQLYATLLSTPGSFGAGLVDVGALSNLSALTRRWCVESSSGNNSSNNNSTTTASNNINNKTKKGKRKTSSPSNRTKRYRSNQESDDEEEEENFAIDFNDDDDDDNDNDPSGMIVTQDVLRAHGCQLARAMAHIPSQLDFVLHWSNDATEVVLDAVVCAQMTAAALQDTATVNELTQSLVTCARHLAHTNSQTLRENQQQLQQYGNDDELLSSSPSPSSPSLPSSATTTSSTAMTMKNRNTLVFMLRGIFSVLCMTIDVPQGQKGKEAAHAAASSTLAQVVAVLSTTATEFEDTDRNRTSVAFGYANTHISSSAPKTPRNSNRRDSNDMPFSSPTAVTPRTGRKHRKKRVSFGTVADGMTIDRMTAPASRNTNTTPSKRTPFNNGTKNHINRHQDQLQSTILGMLQKIVTRPDLDRSDRRQHATGVVVTCIAQLSPLSQVRMVRFLIPTCHSKVSVHRLAGVELVALLLAEPWLWKKEFLMTVATVASTPHSVPIHSSSNNGTTPAKSPMASLQDMPSLPSSLLGCLVSRLSDKAPAVRTRAAQGLVELLNNNDSTLFYNSLQPFVANLQSQLAQRALHDDRATVRKAAIVALSKVAVYTYKQHHNGNSADAMDDEEAMNPILLNVDDTDINAATFQRRTTEVLSHLCGTDPSVAARKAAADGLTQQLLQCDSMTSPVLNQATELERAWTLAVLPLVLDAEPSCVNLAVERFVQVVVEPLGSNNDDEERAWRILACVSDCTEQQGATKGEYEALRTAVRKLSERDDCDAICMPLFCRMRTEALEMGDDDSAKENLAAVWCLLQALTDQPKELPVFVKWAKRKSVGHGFLTEPLGHMLALCKATTEDGIVHSALRCCLHVIGKLAAHIPAEEARIIVAGLKDMLSELYLGPEVISAAVTVMVECLRRYTPDDELRDACAALVDELYTKCEEELSRVLAALGRGSHYVDETDGKRLPRAVFLCGELTMIGFRSDEDGSKTKNSDTCDPIIGLTPKPSAHLLNMIQALLPKTLPGDSVATPEPARAHAFVALGKLCLRDERFAKECLNMFARELHQNLAEPCIAVQSNALLVLGDLCVKYTNLVDRHLPVMAACLQAGATTSNSEERNFLVGGNKSSATALVRKHAILMLSGLLLQDYIKWRGLLFHRFLVASSDTDEGVAALAEMTLCGPLLTKNSKLFYNNFVESLFILNKCTAHPIYMAAATAGGAGMAVGFEGIDLSGETGRARRYRMYQMMLSKMCDEEKIGVAARLAKDILGAAVQTEGHLGRVCRAPSGKTGDEVEDATAFAVLSDAFFVLTSPWLRVGRGSSAASEEDEVVDLPAATGKSEQVAAAKGRLLSKISRKHLVETILPILCNLKSILQASCSPLLKDLMQYLAEMFRAYKVEVKEFLANDPTLLQEVEYDAKKFRKSELAAAGLASPGAAEAGISFVETSPIS